MTRFATGLKGKRSTETYNGEDGLHRANRAFLLRVVKTAIDDAEGRDAVPVWAFITGWEFLLYGEYRHLCDLFDVPAETQVARLAQAAQAARDSRYFHKLPHAIKWEVVDLYTTGGSTWDYPLEAANQESVVVSV
jgi:hypothetical protein